MHADCVHRSIEQLLEPTHSTSQAHELPQATFRHDCAPVHVTVHLPEPQKTSWQVSLPEHSTEHEVALAQRTPLRHQPSTLQRTLHPQPAGQTTSVAQFVDEQSIEQLRVATLHDEQALGQGDASIAVGITHALSTHVRPLLQSLDDVQA